MKAFFFTFFLCLSIFAKATDKDSTITYRLPDTVKAVQFMGEIIVNSITGSSEVFAGIKTESVKLSLESDKNERAVVFEFPHTATVMATGINTDAGEKGEIEWKYNWNINETYRLLIASAADSAADLSLYSAYIFLPKENKWKLIGSCKIKGQWNTILEPAFFYTINKKQSLQVTSGHVWCQDQKGDWQNLNDKKMPVQVIDLAGHVDSIQEHQIEMQLIASRVDPGKKDLKNHSNQLYYQMMKDGTGRQVGINDTVTVFYKLTLLDDHTVIDETRDAAMTFPLNWLIKGWQTGVPLCKTGGKIKLFLPSDLAYSIQNLSVWIPPNSILIYEIEVVDSKSPH
jgi:FKBP-type peptidyl-prolyl cis-trans isomerase